MGYWELFAKSTILLDNKIMSSSKRLLCLPVAEDDDGCDERVLCVVDLHLAHVAAEAEEGLVGQAGLDVVVLGEGVVGGVDDGVALRVVPPGAPQHHDLRRAPLQQAHLKQGGSHKFVRCLLHHVQGDHGGQQLCFVDYIFEVPKCCPTAVQFLPNLHLPKQNWSDSVTIKSKST